MTATAPALAAVQVPEDLVAGLPAGRGRTFVEECYRGYSGWTVSTLAILREAGVTLNELETMRGQRGERIAQRTLIALIAALRLED